MLSFPISTLSPRAMAGLEEQQKKVNGESTRAAKYTKASTLFKAKTPKYSFKEVRTRLADESPAGEACYYCERDRYRDIEHVQPKRHYPERAFDWFNYVYACAICNQDAKRDTYAVFTNGAKYVEFDRRWPDDQPLPIGDPVLFDPRSEDPLEYLQLDLETGSLMPSGGDRKSQVRGQYTRDLFSLDAADLTRTRRNYVEYYLERCRRYIEALDEEDSARAERILDDIAEMEHPTVIVELRRQADLVPGLRSLFNRLPDEIGAWPPVRRKR